MRQATYAKSLRTLILEVETPERLDLLEQAMNGLDISADTKRKCKRSIAMKRRAFAGRLVVPVSRFDESDYLIAR